jgi:hypothetical protein
MRPAGQCHGGVQSADGRVRIRYECNAAPLPEVRSVDK